jgi:aminomethyltransferase
LTLARTGYTGERIGFELFVPLAALLDLWQALVAAGAVPAGLGARDSLRLEAGLPLYGHELGLDRDGNDIPIFANRVARFGVRSPGNGRYVGVEALDAQRAEREAILSGQWRGEPKRLPRLVQPIEALEGRRPLRAGYEVYCGGEPAGYVTSGTSVPIVGPERREAPGLQMRPIGLALLRSDLRFDPLRPLLFEVLDARGSAMQAQLVRTHRNAPGG